MKNIKKIFLFFYLLISLSVLVSCQKEDIDEFIPDPTSGPDSTWYNIIDNTMPVSQLKSSLLLDLRTDSLPVNGTTLFNASSGLQLLFPSGSLSTLNNQPVSGNVKLETHLLRKKGHLIRMGTPTVSNGKLMVSDGTIFVRFTQNANDLKVTPQSNISIGFNAPSPSFLMRKFDGEASSTAAFNWIQNPDSANNQVTISNQMYQVTTNTLRWINCGRMYENPAIPETTVSAILPFNYTNANAIAFTVFNDMNSVVGMFGNASTRQFKTERLPSNRPITVVVLSKQGNDYFMGHVQATTTGVPGTVSNTAVTITPVITTLSNIISYLESL